MINKDGVFMDEEAYKAFLKAKELQEKGKLPISIEEIRKVAMNHYADGGDVIVECWEDYEVLTWLGQHLDNPFKALAETLHYSDELETEGMYNANVESGEMLYPTAHKKVEQNKRHHYTKTEIRLEVKQIRQKLEGMKK